ncbi:MAG: glycoside hydrolase family 13 protein [Clostridia bacterium]|nr:glycoside hydrolase family 13 protein [Clostridia bacterium]
MEYVKYNPTDEFYKSIVGAVGAKVKFGVRLLISQIVKPTAVKLVVYSDDKMQNYQFDMYKAESGNGYDSYIADVSFDKGLYFYYFVMDGVDYEHFIGIGADKKASLYYDNVQPWQLSVYKNKYPAITWLNKGVMYQIMTDRFCMEGKTVATEDKIMRRWGEQPYFKDEDGIVRNRDFFGGNIKGIISKLPYLAELNVKTIYLNPIFKAYSNHKYDTEDYEQIDPMFGTNEDFANLCDKAKKYGIRIILDGVFNHVGSTSKYFNRGKKYGEGGAYNDVNSPYRKWFNFNEDNSYECWWNFQSLPRLNAHSTDAQEYFCGKDGIVPRWIKTGASGWRLDVVDEIDDCMLDKIVSSAKKEMKDCAIIGEVWEDASNKTDYGVRRHYLDGTQLDSVMNYPLKDGIVTFVKTGNADALSNVVFDIVNNYPVRVRNNLMNILGTHDTVRILTNLAGDCLDNFPKEVMSRNKLSDTQYKAGIKLLKISAVLQYTMFGFPCVFYGDEVAMEGYHDPFCRCCYPWGNENKMLLDFYKRLGELRNLSVFCDGDFHQLVAENGVYAFQRTENHTQTSVIVAVNRGCRNYELYLGDTYRDMLCGRKYNDRCVLEPNGYVILEKII